MDSWLPPKPAIIRPAPCELRKATFPGVFPVGLFNSASLTTLTQVLSASDTGGAAFTLPNGIQLGDLIVVFDHAVNTGAPAAVTPSGFTNDINATGPDERLMVSHKIADGTEGGAVVNGMDGNLNEGKLTYVFRGNIPITSVSVLDTAAQHTTGNPTAQTVNASGGVAPLIVLGAYVASSPVDPRTFSPAKDGEINGASAGDMWLAYKIYNSAPGDVNVDMDDEGANNFLASCYIQCS